jgi:hypothetical protein
MESFTSDEVGCTLSLAVLFFSSLSIPSFFPEEQDI